MILADTSVWVDHLRRANPVMIELLTANDILAHPFVIGELACGTLPDRSVLRRMMIFPRLFGSPMMKCCYSSSLKDSWAAVSDTLTLT